MLVLFVRTIILYALVFCVIRLTGKRQISDLQPFDLIVTLLIAEVASQPAANTGIPLAYGIVPILALFLLQQLISYLSMKSEKIRNVVCGRPLILVSRGVVQEGALRGSRYTLSDLMEQLRSKDIFELTSVAYAILETDGQLSVLLKGPQQTITYEALSLPPPVAMPPYLLIQDGKIHHDSLRESGFDEAWLLRQIRVSGRNEARDIFLAMLSASGTLHLQTKDRHGGTVHQVDGIIPEGSVK